MLQDNILRAGKRAHVAHAAMIGLHALCCALPIAALFATAATGATSGMLAFSATATSVHHVLHGHELWVLAASLLLVVLGGALEWAARVREPRGVPWLFLVSLACLAFNIALIASHRAA